MWTSTLIISALAAIAAALAYLRNPQLCAEGLRNGGTVLAQAAPRMVPAFILAGMIQVLLPRDFISKWVGSESGFMGILIGTAAGAMTPGGPYTHFPIVASLYGAGADVAPLVAYLTSWSVLGINRIITWEVPILGPRIALIRIVASVLLPFIAGGLAKLLMRLPSL
ncbi:MAG: permease [Candidatus Tectomicrobia bacterium]|nr:permease [Candidatus Tectomicrobia bacterium]